MVNYLCKGDQGDDAQRMNGFKVYLSNTSTITSDNYLCYKDPYSPIGPYPNIIQTIPCNYLGKYVIYYDNIGSDESSIVYEPIVELCYVAINGCFKSAWETNCSDACPPKCIDQHCYPENGSCIWGCYPQNCLNNKCDKHTGACSEGCVTGLAGQFCNRNGNGMSGLYFITTVLQNVTCITTDYDG
ncbi:unnamed protein product [Mytilus coruscus]|uniref:MEGF10_11 n=1 Tax=Mytilus coruscus TaxID=42192 RepID=A0A6J8A2W8_MYTCO|nr:unnamed protein product [Mytilus coruscus]